MVGGIDIQTGLNWIGSHASGYEWIALIVAIVLAITFLLTFSVALFHPDPSRRADARLLLKNHRLSRKSPRSR